MHSQTHYKAIPIMTNKYSKRAVTLHWLSAILIIAMIVTGINMEHAPHNMQTIMLYRAHFSMGALVFILTLWRLIPLFKDQRPADLYTKGSFRNGLIKFVHYGFYVVVLWMTVSGLISIFLHGFFGPTLSGTPDALPTLGRGGMSFILISHHLVAKIVMLLLVLHLGGIVSHYFQKKENTLKRIWY